jgi:ankyrin repeat protein
MKTVNKKIILALSIFLLLFQWNHAQEKLIFDIVKNGNPEKLRAYLDTTKTSINITNSKGYSPLHVLIQNYVERNDNITFEDNEEEFYKNVDESNSFEDCLEQLLYADASVTQRTPEGWDALQYAVIYGKRLAFYEIKYFHDNIDLKSIKDKDGNSLRHLSLLVNPDFVLDFDALNSLLYPIDFKTLNNLGQTPFVFYMSQERCNWKTVMTKKTATYSNEDCVSEATIKMLEYFVDDKLEAILTKDNSGKNGVDYMKLHNPWALAIYQKRLDEYNLAKQKLEEEEKNQKLKEQENLYSQGSNNNSFSYSNNNSSKNDEDRKQINESFSKKYSYECLPSKYELSTEIYIEVRPDKITVYLPNHVHSCKIISSKFNNEGDLEYEVEDYSFTSIGVSSDLNTLILMRYDGTYEVYCNL